MYWQELLLASDIQPCQSVPRQGWIAWQTLYPSVTAEWTGRRWSAGMKDWATTLTQVVGAEVIHFKGVFNDTINPCLGRCRGRPLQRRTGQNSYLLLAPWALQHTCTRHVHRSTWQRYTQLLPTYAILSLTYLWCQIFICPEVMKELHAAACVFLVCNYLII